MSTPTVEELLARVASLESALHQAQTSKMRHPVEFALWPAAKTEDWQADLSGTITVQATLVESALAEARAKGLAEVKFFINAYNTDGSNNQPVVRGYSDLKRKEAKAA